jgi:hypothetical protein
MQGVWASAEGPANKSLFNTNGKVATILRAKFDRDLNGGEQMPKLTRMILGMLLAVGCAPRAHADTYSVFSISGTDISACLVISTGTPIPGCTPTPGEFAGALEVDATTGVPIAMSILSTNFFDFNSQFPDGFLYPPSLPAFPGSCLEQGSSINEVLYLCITTPTPGSLLGFDGSSIIGWPSAESVVLDTSGIPYVYILGGSITPVLPTPEPCSSALLLAGFGVLSMMRKRMAHISGVPKTAKIP